MRCLRTRFARLHSYACINKLPAHCGSSAFEAQRRFSVRFCSWSLGLLPPVHNAAGCPDYRKCRVPKCLTWYGSFHSPRCKAAQASHCISDSCFPACISVPFTSATQHGRSHRLLPKVGPCRFPSIQPSNSRGTEHEAHRIGLGSASRPPAARCVLQVSKEHRRGAYSEDATDCGCSLQCSAHCRSQGTFELLPRSRADPRLAVSNSQESPRKPRARTMERVIGCGEKSPGTQALQAAWRRAPADSEKRGHEARNPQTRAI